MTTRGKIHTSISALIGLLVILFLVTPAQAQGYIAYAHELPFNGTKSQTETSET